ncbi:MAG: hypothetical protein AAF517_02595 [Planctomycetota bacterium]
MLSLCGACASEEVEGPRGPTLPFRVRFQELDAPDQYSAGERATPVDFSDIRSIRSKFAYALSRTGVFAEVVDDPSADADLEFQLRMRGSDFGEGETEAGSTVFSTLVWILAGHASWSIENRVYSNSDVKLDYRVVFAEESGDLLQERGFQNAGPGFEDRELRLSLWERAGTGDYFYNIFVPPASLAGDPATASSHLLEKLGRNFSRTAAGDLRSLLAAEFWKQRSMWIASDTEEDRLLVVSTRNLRDLDLDRGVVLKYEDLLDREVVDEAERSLFENRFRRFAAGGFQPKDAEHYYSLEVEFWRGPRRIAATLEDGRRARWTIRSR